MTTAELVAELEPLGADAFGERWRVLGKHGVFRRFLELDTLREGCAELSELGYQLDELGVFISIISGSGLALPILAAARGELPTPDFLEEVMRGERVLAVAITERSAGSDVLGMRSALRSEDGRLVLRGSKWNITNAPVADHLIVFCQDETTSQRYLSTLLVPRDAPGVETPPAQKLVGCHGSPTGEILFHDVTIRPEWVFRAPGKQLLDLAFVRERVLAPWPLLGKMARVIQEAIDYIEQREQFGEPIKEFQYVQDKIVQSYERLETSRLLATEALDSLCRGSLSSARASLAKHHATAGAAQVFKTILEVYGSYGLQEDARIFGYLGDALCATVAGGTAEVHKRVVFGELLLDRARSRRRGKSSCFAVTARREPGGGETR